MDNTNWTDMKRSESSVCCRRNICLHTNLFVILADYSCYYRPQRSCGQGNVFTGVCLSTGGGGGCLPQCMLGCQTPLGPGRTPPGTSLSACWDARPPAVRQTPPDQADTPQTRQTPPRPGRPPDQADTPPGPGRPLPGKQTPAYGLRAADTHPTGMHSCFVAKSMHDVVSLIVLFTWL